MADWKYIMLQHDTEQATIHIPIIFPGLLVHSDVRDRMMRVPINNQVVRFEAVSAGFVNFMATSVHDYGDFRRLEHSKVDRAIINQMTYAGGNTAAMLNIESMMLMQHAEHCLALAKDIMDD